MAVMVGFVVVLGALILCERSSLRKWTAAAPGLLAGCYLVCLCWRNEVTVSAGPDGVRKENGPMWGPERRRVIPREAISRVYVRTFVVHGKYGGRFRNVGVETKAGDNLDLMTSCPPHPEMVLWARRVADALEWTEGISEMDGPGKRLWRRSGVAPLLRLGGTVAACGAWALVVMG